MSTYDVNYRVLVEARGTLSATADALLEALPLDARHALYTGIAAEACTAAEDAIFRALNVLSSYLSDGEANRVVQMRQWKSAEDEAEERDAAMDAAEFNDPAEQDRIQHEADDEGEA